MELLCWGTRELGQTGHGRTGDISPEEAHLTEFTMARLGSVKLLACGSSHSVVVTVDNKIFAWGNGTSGQLGNGERAIKDQPVEVKMPQEQNVRGRLAHVDIVRIIGVACGSRHSFIWTEAGQAYGFGNNFYAQLGYDFQRADFKEHQLAPCLFQSLPSSLKICQVACGERHTLFALEDGTVAACGQNDYGQIGSGSNENAVVPRLVGCVHHVSKVTCGANHNLVLTGDGRLFQWGCGRACGNTNRNILFPEEVTLPSLPVRDIAGGCWHSLLLTDGGNVFSWGMGQEGQLGLGEDRQHISTPCLVSYSQLTEVTQIQAADSYSAAVTAGGELLLWGQIPCVSWVSYHTGLKRLWTPQSVPLAGRKVIDVACGTQCMMALTTRSTEKNRKYSHQETEAHFRDLVSNPVPTEKENTVKDSSQVQHKLLQGLETPEGTEEQKTDEESESAEEEERHERKPNTDERGVALHDAAFAIARSAAGIHWTRNGHSSIRSGQGDHREDSRTAGPWGLRNGPLISRRSSRDGVFTTLHLLPRSEGERCRPSATTLPQLLTGQQAQSRVLAVARMDRSANLSQLVQKSGSDSSILRFPRPKPRPPERCTDPEVQKVDSCQQSRIRLHGGRKSSIYNSSLKLSPVQQAQLASPSSHQGPRVKTSFSPTSSSSHPLNYCPTHGRIVSSFDTSWKNL